MVIDPTKLLPPGKEGTPEGRVDNPGVPEGNLTVKQFNSLNKNIFAIQRNLGAIADLIGQRSAQDAQEDKQEIQQKRKSADELKKGTKENFIESSIKQGLLKPLKSLKKKVDGPFGRLMKALEAMFLGWLGIKGIDALEAWSEGDNEAFEKIKNDIIKGLAIAGGIALALNGGIGAITGAISGVLTSMLLNLPKLLGLLANPYVMLGALAIGAGIQLYDILRNDRLSGGRSSYESYTQGVMDIMASEGKEAAMRYLANQKAKLLLSEPRLAKPNLFDRALTPGGALLNEIEQNERSVESGEFDYLLKESLTEDDLKIFNDITAAIKKVKLYDDKYDQLEKEVEAALTASGGYDELSAADKRKFDTLTVLKQQIVKSMNYVRSLRDKLSNDAQKFFNARVDLSNPAMFNASTLDIPLFEEQTGIRIRSGDADPGRLKDLDGLVERLEKDLGKTPSSPTNATSNTSVEQIPESNTPTNIKPAQIIDIDDNKLGIKLEPVSRNFRNIEESTSNPLVTVIPIDDRGIPTEEPVASTPSATSFPILETSNPFNEHLALAFSLYS